MVETGLPARAASSVAVRYTEPESKASSRSTARHLVSAGLLSIAALALTACGSGSPSDAGSASEGSSAPAQAASGELQTVSIGYFPLVHTSTIVNADEAGHLEESGIDAELVQTQGGAAAIPALASGNVDVTYANYTSALLAVQQGLPIVLIAGNDVGADDHGIYVDPDSGIEDIADLKGKSFAMNNLQTGGILAAVESVNHPADHLSARKILAAGMQITREEALTEGFSLRAAYKERMALAAV